MYFETSSPTRRNDKAGMRSPTIQTTDDVCISFKYHMYGATMGTLNVKVNDGNEVIVWSTSGNQGKAWQEAIIDVSRTIPYHVSGNNLNLFIKNIHFENTSFDRYVAGSGENNNNNNNNPLIIIIIPILILIIILIIIIII